jgi:UDP-N-acetylmuramate--alanine ligase
MMTIPKRVHLVGIGGTGLSAIARVLFERGCEVSGSDRLLSPLAQSLQADGVRVMVGHQAENISGAELVVRSSAIADDNVEVQAAQAAGIPVLKRDEYLASLMAEQQGIAVAGTHGKTTTTAMIAWMLTALGLDPSYIIGGVSANLGSNAHAGRGKYFVIEADEYDRMFLGLKPALAVVLNVEHDHPDCYPAPEDFYQAFAKFARLLADGKLLVCPDDAGAERLLAEVRTGSQQVFSFGIPSKLTQPGAAVLDYQAHNLHTNEFGGFSWDAACTLPDGFAHNPTINLRVPGEHNVRNALAALAVSHQLGLPLEKAAQALGEYTGTRRRFELRGEAAGIVVIDDYAHHPTEIRATLAAARQRYPERRLWALWQPHTYSRTRLLADDFAQAFQDADQVIVTEIYASREALPSDNYSALRVVEAMPHPGKHFAPGLTEATMLLLEFLQPGDVLIVFSAGDADQISTYVLDALHNMEEYHA